MILVDKKYAWLLETYSHSLDVKGYVILSIDGQHKAKLHRKIWSLEFGAISATQLIDHKNGNKQDNMLSNLRLVTPSQNAQNQSRARGFKGVTRLKKTGRWMARICKEGISYYLGVYPSKELAIAAYDDASKVVHGEFGRTNGA